MRAKCTINIDWSDYFYYDVTSPSLLRWKIDRRRGFGEGYIFISAGDVAGSLNNTHKYYIVNVEKMNCLAHRVVWELFNDKLSMDAKVDHIDGDVSNNRIENLRVTTMEFNCRNKKMYLNNSSGATGVSYVPEEGRFRAMWSGSDGKTKSKSFRINGDKLSAFKLACDYRRKMIEELNGQGAGYTDRHGVK